VCEQAHSRASVERYFRDWPNPVGFGTSSDIASSVASLPTGLAMTEFFPSREPLKVVRTKRWIHRQLGYGGEAEIRTRGTRRVQRFSRPPL
jgi:hypothetical protein